MGAKTVIQYKINIYLKSSFYLKKYYTRELRIFLYLIIHSGSHHIIKYGDCWCNSKYLIVISICMTPIKYQNKHVAEVVPTSAI